MFEIKGFRDNALKGEWQGARASRLNDQWRVIYYVVANEIKILVMEATLQELSQNELAKLSGLPQSTISGMESGRINIGVERAKALRIAEPEPTFD